MIFLLLMLGCDLHEPRQVNADTDTDTDTDTDPDTDSETDTETDTDTDYPPAVTCGWTGDGPYTIPDPGESDGSGNCSDNEPNDTPDQAVTCGTSGTAFSAAIYCAGSLGGADAADHFVFRTHFISDLVSQYSYWNSGGNLLDQVLFEVTDDCTDLVEVYRWDDTDSGWENGDHGENAPVKPNTIYVMQFLNIEGVGDYGS